MESAPSPIFSSGSGLGRFAARNNGGFPAWRAHIGPRFSGSRILYEIARLAGHVYGHCLFVQAGWNFLLRFLSSRRARKTKEQLIALSENPRKILGNHAPQTLLIASWQYRKTDETIIREITSRYFSAKNRRQPAIWSHRSGEG
ncbi:hypothetical protein GWI33_008645 [Rhynchophorus ferrugineus]|uniref:Uncharacterized protein n=1 Tax=Rhynchophorus ferrugineus TaxID=354439 RepID=A0A834MFU2_RHYFE|nr:hypothetical protein GWI33_008645 [Rhynchophorus ferrugineus]